MKPWTPEQMRQLADAPMEKLWMPWVDQARAALRHAANELEAADEAVRAERARAEAAVRLGKEPRCADR